MVDFSLVAVSAPKSSDHTDYSILQFYGKRGITQNVLKILFSHYFVYCS
jgi:hypothetical protein